MKPSTSTSSLLNLALLIPSAISLALPGLLHRQTADYTAAGYTATDYTTGCSEAGCTYTFALEWEGSATEPAFSTTCNGTNIQDKWAPCAAVGPGQFVSSNSIPGEDGEETISIQHGWVEGEDDFVIYANATLEFYPSATWPTTFVVTPYEETATA
jgi:hypothetical protein